MLNVKGKLSQIEKRLKKSVDPVDPNEKIISEWIKAGRYYDELSVEEKDLYNRYWDCNMAGLYEMFEVEPHFELELKQPPLTDEQFRERCREIREYMQGIENEYNSEEAQEERRQEYEKCQRIGALRRQAYENGEDMSAYPLPWQTNK